MADLTALKKSYDERESDCRRLTERLAEQIGELLSAEGISLAVPIERRLKSWQSLAAKIDNKSLFATSALEVTDLVGLRVILLFRRDTERVRQLLDGLLHEASTEDVTDRLGTQTFGYQSIHLRGKLPRDWVGLPTFRGCSDLPVEVQVRTAAQHIWAAASHLLQYKREGSVPRDVLRSINRVSALLETVDLEFERVLDQREEYSRHADTSEDSQELNVDLLRKILDERLPFENKWEDEDYDATLAKLREAGVSTLGDLEKLFEQHLGYALAYEAKRVDKKNHDAITKLDGDRINVSLKKGNPFTTTEARRARGVWLNHQGLITVMLRNQRTHKKQ